MPATSLKVAILGVSGRMGRALLAAIDERGDVVLGGAAASASSRWIGCDVSAVHGGSTRNVIVAATPAEALRDADVAIDFTLPEATCVNVQACVAAKRPLMLGTTGHDADSLSRIEQAALEIPIVKAANTSLGVNLLFNLVQIAARTLNETYDIEIYEAHHRSKKDAPSGTALALGRAAAAGRNADLDALADYDRSTQQMARDSGSIGFSVFRGGDVVGEHTVTFAGLGERIELTHRVSDRMTFARGALTAAEWLKGRAPGLYSMHDVLGLREIS